MLNSRDKNREIQLLHLILFSLQCKNRQLYKYKNMIKEIILLVCMGIFSVISGFMQKDEYCANGDMCV